MRIIPIERSSSQVMNTEWVCWAVTVISCTTKMRQSIGCLTSFQRKSIYKCMDIGCIVRSNNINNNNNYKSVNGTGNCIWFEDVVTNVHILCSVAQDVNYLIISLWIWSMGSGICGNTRLSSFNKMRLLPQMCARVIQRSSINKSFIGIFEISCRDQRCWTLRLTTLLRKINMWSTLHTHGRDSQIVSSYFVMLNRIGDEWDQAYDLICLAIHGNKKWLWNNLVLKSDN